MAGELRPLQINDAPYVFDVDLRQTMSAAMRKNVEAQREFQIMSDGRVRISAPDMDLGFRRVAYLVYADAAGVPRY